MNSAAKCITRSGWYRLNILLSSKELQISIFQKDNEGYY